MSWAASVNTWTTPGPTELPIVDETGHTVFPATQQLFFPFFFRRMAIIGGSASLSAERPTEAPKVGVQVFRCSAVQGSWFRVFRAQKRWGPNSISLPGKGLVVPQYPEGWGGEGQNFAFFPSPATIFFLPFLRNSGGPRRGRSWGRALLREGGPGRGRSREIFFLQTKGEEKSVKSKHKKNVPRFTEPGRVELHEPRHDNWAPDHLLLRRHAHPTRTRRKLGLPHTPEENPIETTRTAGHVSRPFLRPGPPDDTGHWDQSTRDMSSPSYAEQLQGRPRQCSLRLCAGSRRNAVEKPKLCPLPIAHHRKVAAHQSQFPICVRRVRSALGGPCPSPTC